VGRLATIYLHNNPDVHLEGRELEARLLDLCNRGRAAHPGLEVGDEAFVAHVAKCGAHIDTSSEVHAEDLFLVCACLAGDANAVDRLRKVAKSALAGHLSRISGALAMSDEIEQRLWNDVLVDDGDGPKLGRFAGRGPIGAWMGVIGQRHALLILRHERLQLRLRDEAAAEVAVVADDAAMAVMKRRYREQLNGAVAGALASLSDRDKTLYRMHFVDRLTLETIGRAYGVHHSTVLRWLANTRKRVIEETKVRLRATLLVSSADFDSIARLLLSQLDIDISSAFSRRA
jgi:RNA polymerase sigma-70 factor (ECF subfamily)